MAVDPEQAIVKLETALSTGTLEVTIEGKSVRYESASAIREAIDYFRDQQRQAQKRRAVKVSVGGMWRG